MTQTGTGYSLIDIRQDFPTSVLSTGLLVVHDAGRGGEDDLADGAGREELRNPVLDRVDTDVEPRRDDTTLVQPPVQLDDDFARAVVIDDLEFANVAVPLHDRQALDDHLRTRANEDLTLSTAFGVDDVVQSIVQD